MFSRLAKVALVATAIAPVFVIYALVQALDGKYLLATALVLVAVILALACFKIIGIAENTLEESDFQINSIEAADRENVAFLLLYLLPLALDEPGSPNLLILGAVTALFALVVATGYNYHFNPILGMRGWHFYKVGTPEGVTYILLTKKTLRNKTKQFRVVHLTEYMVLEV